MLVVLALSITTSIIALALHIGSWASSDEILSDGQVAVVILTAVLLLMSQGTLVDAIARVQHDLALASSTIELLSPPAVSCPAPLAEVK